MNKQVAAIRLDNLQQTQNLLYYRNFGKMQVVRQGRKIILQVQCYETLRVAVEAVFSLLTGDYYMEVEGHLIIKNDYSLCDYWQNYFEFPVLVKDFPKMYVSKHSKYKQLLIIFCREETEKSAKEVPVNRTESK
jgi:hypothetical protein